MENNKKELNLGEMTPRERLDAYGIKWSKEKDTMSQEEKRNLFIMITNEAFQLFAPNRFNESGEVEANALTQDALADVLMRDVFDNFDLEKSSEMQLSRYISSRINPRKIDIYRSENGRPSKKKSDESDDDQPVKYNPRNVISLDTPIDEDGELVLGDTIADESGEMEMLEASINITDMFETIVSALRTQRMRGKTMEYYRVMYTADIIYAEKKLAARLFSFQHERMIDEELSGGFVDYCMADKCEGVEDIYYVALKLYGEVVEDTGAFEKDEPIPLPMEDKVGVSYLKTSKGNYSKHHTKYRELIDLIRR